MLLEVDRHGIEAALLLYEPMALVAREILTLALGIEHTVRRQVKLVVEVQRIAVRLKVEVGMIDSERRDIPLHGRTGDIGTDVRGEIAVARDASGLGKTDQ